METRNGRVFRGVPPDVGLPPPTRYPQAVWDELARQRKFAARATGYMSCRTNREPPHSKEARSSRNLAPRQQRTIPYRRIKALPDLGGYNALNLIFRRRV